MEGRSLEDPQDETQDESERTTNGEGLHLMAHEIRARKLGVMQSEGDWSASQCNAQSRTLLAAGEREKGKRQSHLACVAFSALEAMRQAGT